MGLGAFVAAITRSCTTMQPNLLAAGLERNWFVEC
jgi:hypothetical protein